MNEPWIGVDLDGTLAEYHGWNGGKVGGPIPLMVERVKKWLAEGKSVRILTARVGVQEDAYSEESGSAATKEFAERQRKLIEEWCLKHIGRKLPVTASKDFAMVELWDDRAVSVEHNTGRVIEQELARKCVALCRQMKEDWDRALHVKEGYFIAKAAALFPEEGE